MSTGESAWPGGGRCQDMPWPIVIINTNQSDWIYESQLKQVSHRPGCGDKDNGNVEIQLKSVGPVLTATAECEAVITGLMGGGGRKRAWSHN